jgi:hypothetical protein
MRKGAISEKMKAFFIFRVFLFGYTKKTRCNIFSKSFFENFDHAVFPLADGGIRQVVGPKEERPPYA